MSENGHCPKSDTTSFIVPTMGTENGTNMKNKSFPIGSRGLTYAAETISVAARCKQYKKDGPNLMETSYFLLGGLSYTT
jgi:hypothetical protein